MSASPLKVELYSYKFFWTFGLVSSNKLKMPSIYLFYLELVLTSVVANNVMNTTQDSSSPETIIVKTAGAVDTSSTTSITTSITTETLKTPETNRSMSTSNSNTNTTSTPGHRNETQTRDGDVARSTTPMKPSSAPTPRTKKISLSTKRKPITTAKPKEPIKSNETTGIIVVVVIALVIVVFAVACFVSRRRGRRYSVDFVASPDENVPLGTIDPEVRAESAPQNGLKTFASTETAATEPKGPEVTPETQEEKKEEAAITAAAPSAEAAAPPEAAAASAPQASAAAPPEAAPAAPPEAPATAPSPDSSEEKPKEDDAKQSSSARVDPLPEEKTDDEGAVSNKTSVESLKETNENNSNNSGSSQRRDWQRSNTMWEVGVDCPV